MKQILKRFLPASMVAAAKSIWHPSQFQGRVAQNVFATIYEKNLWQGDESASGPGSDLSQTKVLSSALSTLLRDLQIRSILDAPCGDFNWMRFVDLSGVAYVGADIVPALVARNVQRFPAHEFQVLDMIKGPIPKVDLIFCRDALVHLSYRDVQKSIANFRASGSRYLMATTFPGRENRDITTGEWRPIDLEAQPFAMGSPLLVVNECCTEDDGSYADKSMALWELASP